MNQTVPPNPFTPSFGRVPPILVGRDILLGEMTRAFNSNGSDPNLCTILIGTRGSGKTALLTYLAQAAQAQGWVSARVSAIPGMLEDIMERSLDAASNFVEQPDKIRLKSLSIGQFFGAEWEYRDPGSGNWRTRMSRLLEKLNDADIGLLITVDEVIGNLDEMKQLAATFQHFVSENRKVALLMAGLPANVSSLLDDKSVSFLLRASQRTLGRLNDEDVRYALAKTAEENGRTFDEDALNAAVQGIEGFPYLMQLVGFFAWNASPTSRRINMQDAAEGVERASEEFFSGVLKRTYAKLSEQDKAFLHAMTRSQTSNTIADIAKHMGKSESYARIYRKRLVEQGLINVPGRNTVEFALPLMKSFLERVND